MSQACEFAILNQVLIRLNIAVVGLSFCRPLKRANNLLGDVIPGLTPGAIICRRFAAG
jgi:hypothetical protein